MAHLPTARLACTFTLCCTSEDMPLFWLTTMMPAADWPTLLMVFDMSKVPALTLLVPPAPPVPPVPAPPVAVPAVLVPPSPPAPPVLPP
ncbi:hypothetical protein GM658_24110, partial [Pseudoduganella eburnea]|nr:hypothetical protein [Massilia eburnea]